MDSPKPNEQSGGAPGATKSSIDSLRTVEFRTTIRGYHMDDVDEYLERVAVEAEALQEQTRQSVERVKQALERVTSLEQQLEQARRVQQQLQQAQQNQPTQAVASVGDRDEPEDDSLKRTLMLAQKFVDQTRQEAEDEARNLLSESEARARVIVSDAEQHARALTEDAERKLREEVQRLDGVRASLSEEVEAMTRRLDSERSRIRKSLTEMLTWVDEKVRPATPAQTPKPFEPQTGPASGAGSSFGMGGGSSDGTTPQPRASEEPKPEVAPATTATARDTTEVSGSAGPPTERIPVSSISDEDRSDAEDVELEPLGSRDGSSIRASHDRLLPGQQREMFAPGLQSNQAGSATR